MRAFTGVERIVSSESESRELFSQQVRENLSLISQFLFFIFAMSVVCLFMGSRAHAQASSISADPAKLVTAAKEKNTTKPYVFAGELLIETLRNADEESATTYRGWYKFTPSVTHTDSGMTLTSKLAYTREYSYERADGTDGDTDNPIVTLSKTFANGDHYDFSGLDSVSLSLVGVIGSSREAQRRTYLGSTGLLVTGTNKFGKLTVQQAFGYSRGYFDNDIRSNGVVNSPNSFKSLTAASYSFTDKLSVGGMLTYSYAISFQDVGRGSQLGAVSVNYKFSDRITGSLGVVSDKSTIEPDGQSDRIRVYAPDVAQYFVDVILTL